MDRGLEDPGEGYLYLNILNINKFLGIQNYKNFILKIKNSQDKIV